MATAGHTTFSGPFATAARLYRAAGWHGTLPVGAKAGEKWPPPKGFTGHGAPDPSAADVEAWIETHGDRNIGLRVPVGVLGLDVDAYVKDDKVKAGADALAELEARFGPLPPTWVSSARPAPSGIRWFRVPTELDGRPINWPGEAAKGIELIQHGHRYAVVWPSTNPEAGGAQYRWHKQVETMRLDPEDVIIPRAEQLAHLPDSWVRGLALSYARTEKAELGGHDLAAWWDLLRPAPACPRVIAAMADAEVQLRAGRAGRHETARDAARTIAAYGGEGHAGSGEALLALGETFVDAVKAPGRDAEAEWGRMLAGAVELAATDNPAPRQLCACAPPNVLAPPPPAALNAQGEAVVPVPLPDERVTEDALTDSKIAEAVCDDTLRGTHCWAPGLGWMAWTGQRWRGCSEESVVEVVRLWLARFVGRHMENVFVSADRATSKAITALESAYRLGAITRLCRGVLHVDADAFDSHADLLNTPSGIVDLRTGELLPHDPALRFTRITGTPYVPGVEHVDWTVALSAVPDEVADWLQVRFGQSITGHMTPDDLLLILQGGGENGKSTILNAIKQAVGGYGTYISDRVLLADPNAHPTEMMDFRGARFALTEELPDEARFNIKRLKDVVGSPTIKGRYMRQDAVEFRATHSFFLSTNPIPLVTDTDHGTWRRLALVRFPYRFRKPTEALTGPDDRHGDPGLRDRLADGEKQREAVLAWLVAGAIRWYAAGMPEMPEAVQTDTAEWRASSDPIEGFWRERLRPDPDSYITAGDMLAEFNAYLASLKQHDWSARRFLPVFAEHSRTREHRVFYKVGAPGARSRSFRPLVHGVMPPSPFVPAADDPKRNVRAWWGVRFVTATEAEQG